MIVDDDVAIVLPFVVFTSPPPPPALAKVSKASLCKLMNWKNDWSVST